MKKNIVDVFPYFNEKELLELRVRMLEPYVDQFVISEANRTHSGLPKEYTLKKVIDELGLPKDKIRVIEVDLYAEDAQAPSYIDICHATSAKSEDDAISWARERLQRDAIAKCIDDYSDDTVFIMSDCDEIVDPKFVDFLAWKARIHSDIIIRVPLRLLESKADLAVYDNNDNPVPWDESMFLCMKHHIKKTEITLLKANKTPNEFSPWQGLFLLQDGIRIENMGWHFTWMGDRERKLYKSKSFIHHSNLNVVNNVSDDTIEFLSKHLEKNINTEKKYKLKKIDHSLLPEKIFELDHVKSFLLGEDNKGNPMIVNCFPYVGQKELLELRIRLLENYVDQFVIIDADRAHSGIHQDFSCNRILDELGISKEKIKIIELNLPGQDTEKDSSIREMLQRDEIAKHVPKNSLCYVTDADEIPDPLFFNYYTGVLKENPNYVIKVPMVHLSTRADLVLEKEGIDQQNMSSFLCFSELFTNCTVSEMRNGKTRLGGVIRHPYLFLNDNGKIENAGWKFEWMGDRESRKEQYRNSALYDSHSTLGRRVRLEYIDEYEPQTNAPEIMGSKEFTLKDYSISSLPSIIFENVKYKNFLLPERKQISKSQSPLEFGQNLLPHIKLNSKAENMVYIVDNFYADPHAIREFALNQEFENNPNGERYIGRRTLNQYFPQGLKEKFEEIIGEKITIWEGHGMNGRFQYTVAGDRLVYHCDDQKWAGLIYLTPDAPYQAGTKLLAHKKTRIRYNKDPDIMECFNQDSNFCDGTPYETVDHVGNVFNRLVLYKGGMIHAASEYFGWNKNNGRLWHMFFFDAE
jgi:hypothetical protein